MYILSIDTSTTFCSVALHKQGEEVYEINLGVERAAASLLTTMIQNAVELTGITLEDLSAIALAAGPGSYTGLRVSASTAKGLCFALDKPLISVNTLEGMVHQVIPFFKTTLSNAVFIPMIDARRMEVYSAVYGNDGSVLQEVAPEIVTEESYKAWLERGPVVFFGDGAAKCESVIGQHSNAHFLKQDIIPKASTIGKLAQQKLELQQFEDLASFEPFYLKAFMVKTKQA